VDPHGLPGPRLGELDAAVAAGLWAALLAPLLGLAVRRSIARDLRNLKRVLEGRPLPSGR
jgi:hypothetical protein